MKIDLNGNIIEQQQAVVSVYDHGFLYGMGAFETFRTYGGQPFLLDRHVDRLRQACAQLDIDFGPDARDISRRAAALLAANGLEDGYFRFTVSAGAEELGLPSGPYRMPTEILYLKALPALQAPPNPGRALQLLTLRRSTPEGSMRLKSLHYMNNILAKQEMRRYPWAAAAEGLFLDQNGHLCEGIVSNLFFVKAGILHTPSEETGLLAGITRRFVMELGEAAGMQVREDRFNWSQLLDADEIFLTNSIQEIVPVSMLCDANGPINGWSPAEGQPVTRKLALTYREAATQTCS